MKKERVSNLASVGIIFRTANPSEIFIEIKDDGYPLKVFRRCLCPIGGNWIGEAGKRDRKPLDTFRREFDEEISLQRAIASTLELKLLGFEPEGNFYQTPKKDYIPTSDETKIFAELKQVIAESCTPFGDFKCQIPKEVILREEPESKREGFTAIVSYWLVAVSEDRWKQLTNLQRAFGNLSNESITIITSLREIIETGTKTAFGHDRALQKFFLSFGLKDAYRLPFIEGIQAKEVGKTLASYEEYMSKYDIQRKSV